MYDKVMQCTEIKHIEYRKQLNGSQMVRDQGASLRRLDGQSIRRHETTNSFNRDHSSRSVQF